MGNYFHGPVDASGASFGDGPITNNWPTGEPAGDLDTDEDDQPVIDLSGQALGSGTVTNVFHDADE